MRSKATLGWLVVVAALGAAGYIVYRSTALRSADGAGGGSGGGRKVPDTLFSDPAGKSSSPLTNPISGGASAAPAASTAPVAAGVPVSTQAPAAAPPGGTAAAAPPAAPPVPPEAPPAPAEAPPPAPPPAETAAETPPSPLPGAEPPAPGPSAAETPKNSTGTVGLVLLSRDPTLSPFDNFRQEQLELEKLVKRREVEAALQQAAPVKKRERRIDEGISLQGIITDADGNTKAIINGEVVGQGDTVAEDAKILRISPQEVQFQRGGKKFRKRISK